MKRMGESNILFTRPSYDYTTRYLSAWNEEVMESAGKKQCVIFDLEGMRANRKELESFYNTNSPSWYF